MKKNVNLIAKRKSAVASGVITDGTGRITINNKNISAYSDGMMQMMVSEPLSIAGELAKKYDVDIRVFGGGAMSRAQAIRAVIAKSLARREKSLKKKFLEYDRTLLVDDKRMTEPQKPYRSAARALKQTSYR